MLHVIYTTGITGAPFVVALDTDAADPRGRAVGRVAWFDMRYLDHVGRKYPKLGGIDVAGQFVTAYDVPSFMDGWQAKDRGDGSFALFTDIDSWRIGAAEIRAVREWVADCYRRKGREVPAEEWPELSI